MVEQDTIREVPGMRPEDMLAIHIYIANACSLL